MCLMLTFLVCLAWNPVCNASPFVIFCSLYFLIGTIMNYVFELLPLMRSFFFIFAGEWLDLDEHDYRIFGSQFSKHERISSDLSQGRSPEKTRAGVMKGRLGALKGYTATCVDSPSTPKNPIVELIDNDDDAFDKIVGMGRVTRSAAAAKGLS